MDKRYIVVTHGKKTFLARRRTGYPHKFEVVAETPYETGADILADLVNSAIETPPAEAPTATVHEMPRKGRA